ncbi:rho-related BTB domain-containing protein 1-like [Centruroides vittatus]|uniref:rho-related BTB domain-containing protein 1-like n=1 Tax=Centruroides vittatus TaxID=120091 RepID=UPI00350EA454
MDNDHPNQELVKCVVVGDTAVGKTRLIRSRACDAPLTLSQLLTTHIPTVWAVDQYRIHKEVLKRSVEVVDGVNVSLRLWDTFGDHDKDRRFAYGRSDVVLLCFSVTNPLSLRNCKVIWYPEIRQFCPNTPIVLVGCKNDLRFMYREEEFLRLCRERSPFFRPLKESDIVPSVQGREIAKEIGAPYYEASVLTKYGVSEVFENVIRAALLSRRQQRFWMTNLKHVRYPLLQSPFCPPKPVRLKVTVPPSHYSEEMLSLFLNQWCYDAMFLVGKKEICVHRVVLAAASEFFFNFFTTDHQSPTPADSAIELCSSESAGSSANTEITVLSNSLETMEVTEQDDYHRPFQILYHSKEIERRDSSGDVTVITVMKNICSDILHQCLRFLYCGKSDNCTQRSFSDLKEGSTILEISELKEILAVSGDDNYDLDEESCQKYIERMQERMHILCLNTGLFSDVLFQLEDGIVPAHKPILIARCDVMAAMFSGDFCESSAKIVPFPGVSKECFKQLLVYLYTDNVDTSVSATNCLPLLELANRLCLPHLVAAVEERVVSELIEMCQKGINTTELTLKLLEQCQIHNADQLAEWCLHDIAINYNSVCLNNMKLLRNLHPENQAYLNKNRWPPIWYTKEYEYYEQCLRQRHWQEKPPKPSRPKKTSCRQIMGCLCFRPKSKSFSKSAVCNA